MVRPALAASVNDSAYRFGLLLHAFLVWERSPHAPRYTQRSEPGKHRRTDVMSWPKRLHAAHGPMLESADAGEPTGPSRPVALHTRGYASGLAPRFGTGVVVGNSHAIRLANTAVNQILAAQQAPSASHRQLLLRDYVADSPNRKTARAPSTLDGVEPDWIGIAFAGAGLPAAFVGGAHSIGKPQ